MSRTGWWVLLAMGCAGDVEGNRDRNNGEPDTPSAPIGSTLEAGPPCGELCADRAADCGYPADQVNALCDDFCSALWTDADLQCLATATCEELEQAVYTLEPGDSLCAQTCESTCDGANGAQLIDGVEAAWLQFADCEVDSDTLADHQEGPAPGEACGSGGALSCGKHPCSCCGGDETFYAAGCRDGVCVSSGDACELAETAAADPFFSAHLCD